MCTLAWGHNTGRFWACFNRDEQHSRPEASLPEMTGKRGNRLVFARDPLGMGSWFVAAERGHAVALLNHHPEGWRMDVTYPKSRGQIVLEVAHAFNGDGIDPLLQENSLRYYGPFHLFILGKSDSLAYTWDTSTLHEIARPPRFLTTSSIGQDAIISWRQRWWLEQTSGQEIDDEVAAEILRQVNTENPAWGTTMDRSDARTVSQIQLRMEPTGFRFLYRQRDPDGNGYLTPVSIDCRH